VLALDTIPTPSETPKNTSQRKIAAWAMDHRSILDLSSAPSAEGDITGGGASRPVTASVSAGIAAANAHLPKSLEPEPRFPGEDGGQSLAKMAQRDLDAALQLLAERAQYITGASGAAIALRRGEHADMRCRASAGSNAPELGALLSMEYGLSGESVRTRQALRCDDTESDSRVNREGCRQLGIASVVVMPIVSEQQVIGVFELFSGRPRAFEERDLSALQRLSEMVETAVKHAVAALSVPAAQESAGAEVLSNVMAAEVLPVESAANVMGADLAPLPLENDTPPLEPETAVVEMTTVVETEVENAEPGPAPKSPRFWSAAMQSASNAVRTAEPTESIPVPLELRNLQKCKACGFPVSAGRMLCVECEEKQWRGQRLPQPTASVVAASSEPLPEARRELEEIRATEVAQETSGSRDSSSAQASIPTTETAAGEIATGAPVTEALAQNVPPHISEDAPIADDSTLFLSSAAPSESWFAANKYILGALLVVAIVIGVIAWLR